MVGKLVTGFGNITAICVAVIVSDEHPAPKLPLVSVVWSSKKRSSTSVVSYVTFMWTNTTGLCQWKIRLSQA